MQRTGTPGGHGRLGPERYFRCISPAGLVRLWICAITGYKLLRPVMAAQNSKEGNPR
ncbi:MAG: hypothetical protein K0S39_5353 [Paenibacillus sp.]|jgi:hypothetical protein|nr:hypothetical protein [Paenibacillus sp.]